MSTVSKPNDIVSLHHWT